MQFYNTVLKPFLENQIIVDWIAPIITGLILLALPTLITNNIRNKNLIKNINLVNNKIIDTIRPFIIQRIDINSSYISNIRRAIIKDNNIKEQYIYDEIEIKNKIIFDISETRFLKEKDKYDLIEFTNKIFHDFNEKQLKQKKIQEKKSQERVKLVKIIFSFITIIILFILFINEIINRKKHTNISNTFFYLLYIFHLFIYT